MADFPSKFTYVEVIELYSMGYHWLKYREEQELLAVVMLFVTDVMR